MRLLILILLLLSTTLNLSAQGVEIREERTNEQVTIWAKNNLPCDSQISARTTDINQIFQQFVPKATERILLQLPADSIDDKQTLKDELAYNIVSGLP
ncbi:MAG: hypothetical protein U5J63_14925 [Fodinibius sp.]|nr:hypothetical protein [Fodinibius sp.]